MNQKRWNEAIEKFNKAMEYALINQEKAVITQKLKEVKICLDNEKVRKIYWKWYNLGMKSIHQKRWKKAIENFNNAIKYAITDEEKEKAKERLKEAKISLNKETQQENYQKWYKLGIMSIEQKRWESALENLNNAIKYAITDEEKEITKEKLRVVEVNLDKETQMRAKVSLENPLAIAAGPAKTKGLQETSTMQTNLWIAIISTFASLLLITLLLFLPQFNPVKAKIYLWQKKYYKAASIYENAISKGKKVWFYPVLADIYLKLDRIDEDAIKVYDRAIYLNSNNRKMVKIVADHYIKENRIGDRAIEVYEDALKFDPDNIQLLNILGRAYSNRGDDKKATIVYQKIYDLGEADKLVIRNLANAYLKENRLDDAAITVYEEALEDEPENHDLIITLSQAYINKGRRDEKTIEIYKKSVGVCSNLVRSYKERNDLEKANQYADLAYRIVVYYYSVGVVNTLVRDSVMGILSKL